jgi:hypothetical protein
LFATLTALWPLKVIVGVGTASAWTSTVLPALVGDSPELAGKKLVAPTAPYPCEVTDTLSDSVGAFAAMATLAEKFVSLPGVTERRLISGAALPSICVKDSVGLVPNPAPETIIGWFGVPAYHLKGATQF